MSSVNHVSFITRGLFYVHFLSFMSSMCNFSGAGGAIAAAASQAIAATQQLSGRRSSSLKASYEAINLGLQSNEFSVGRELAGAAQAAIAGTTFETPKKQKLKTPKNQQEIISNSPGFLDILGSQDNSNQSFGASTDQEWGVDPNEPRYCICNQISYGDMVACDNDDVSRIFFHYYLLIHCHFFCGSGAI